MSVRPSTQSLPPQSAPAEGETGLAFFYDRQPDAADMRGDILAGLSRPRKSIPPKYFYDAPGSALFDRITELPEYYPTRAELSILRAIGPELAAHVGPEANVLEFGSGSSLKIRTLLDALERPHLYVGVDISREHLLAACRDLKRVYPHLAVGAICADFTHPFRIPEREFGAHWRVGFFPGSTIGNFEPEEAKTVLRAMRAELRPNDSLLIGVDLQKDADMLQAAYDDAAGVTAAFNLNVLSHINRALGADIPVDAFAHEVRYDADHGRIEMYLRALRDLEFTVAGQVFVMRAGERIHTENSHKYTRESFDALAAEAGFRPYQYWTDADGLFSVRLMRAV
jgi:dimethylhistidine N-methyltransferase